jgi:pimeloyl-ACP methyl ester carboxylesterase
MRRLVRVSVVILAVVVVPIAALAQTPIPSKPVARAAVDGVELEYEVRGRGETVVLIHAGIFADWFAPLLARTELTDKYRVVSYHRAGYAGSTHPTGAVSIAEHATHLRALMRHLGIVRAHLVGHSSGGNIALQLAMESPELVQSIALLEAAIPATTDSGRLLASNPAMAPAFERFRAGDHAGAVDFFMRMVSGPDYRASLDRVMPGAFERGVADAATFFAQELPALREWTFTREAASRISQPVLAVMGERSPSVSPIWPRRHEILLTWLPNVEPFVLPGTTHVLHIEEPRAMANALVTFFARHRITAR